MWFHYISLCETWLMEEGWDSIKKSLPKTHEWSISFMKKDRGKGKVKRDFLLARSKIWGNGEGKPIQGIDRNENRCKRK